MASVRRERFFFGASATSSFSCVPPSDDQAEAFPDAACSEARTARSSAHSLST
jgi:hypothetical protein